jgi:predicted ATPase
LACTLSAITKLAGMIKSAASRDTQVIVATQSSDLVNHFEADDIITVDQVKGQTKFKRLQERETFSLARRLLHRRFMATKYP